MTQLQDPRVYMAEAAINSCFASNPDLIGNLLASLGAYGIKPLSKCFRSTCPIHAGNNPSNFAVWYDRETPIWQCYSKACGKGSLPRLPQEVFGVSYVESVEYLCHFLRLPPLSSITNIPNSVLEQIASNQSVVCRNIGAPEKQQVQVEVFPEYMITQSMSFSNPYFLNRRFSQEILSYFQTGFVPAGVWWFPNPKVPGSMRGWREDRVTIPIRTRDGRLIGFSGRRIDGVDFNKYQTLSGTLKSETLYGIHRPECIKAIMQTRHVVLVEGYTDVMRGHQFGFYNVLSMMGTDLSATQLNLIEEFCPQHITVYTDNDIAGRDVASVLRERLASMCRVCVAFSPHGDPDDSVTPDDFIRPIVSAA